MSWSNDTELTCSLMVVNAKKWLVNNRFQQLHHNSEDLIWKQTENDGVQRTCVDSLKHAPAYLVFYHSSKHPIKTGAWCMYIIDWVWVGTFIQHGRHAKEIFVPYGGFGAPDCLKMKRANQRGIRRDSHSHSCASKTTIIITTWHWLVAFLPKHSSRLIGPGVANVMACILRF